MRKRVAAALLVLGSIGALPGVAQAETTAETAVSGAYEQWQDALGARQECASGVSVILEALPERQGEYRVGQQQVVVDPDTDVDMLPAVVVHELSHHTFIACGAFAEPGLAEVFFAEQDLPRQRDWFDYSSGWDQTPVEQFAEAMTVYVTGSASSNIDIAPETVDIIARWLAAAPLTRTLVQDQTPTPYASTEAVDEQLVSPQPIDPETTDTRSTPATSEPPEHLVEMVRIAQWLRDFFRNATP